MSQAEYQVRPMRPEDAEPAAGLQAACFPPPFPAELLWQPRHLLAHMARFADGQFVAEWGGRVIGSASSLRVSLADFAARHTWEELTGGLDLSNHNPRGDVLYGADISVHPSHRGKGVARALYRARFGLVRSLGLAMFATVCRLPGYRASGIASPALYADLAGSGALVDPTLTPLLRMGLLCTGIIEDHMDDPESGNAAAILEWRP